MEFWSELSKKISSAADYTVKETEKLTNITKLKYKLSGLKNKRDQLFKAVGKAKYLEYSGEETDLEDTKEKFEMIKDLISQIEDIEEDIAILSNYRICQQCRSKVERDMVFCPKCGAKQPEEEFEDTDEDETAGDSASFEATENVSDAEKLMEESEDKEENDSDK